MYRCNVCNAKRSSGMPQLRHAMLAKGAPLADVVRQRGPRQPDPLPVPPTPVPAASMAPPVYRPVVLGARR